MFSKICLQIQITYRNSNSGYGLNIFINYQKSIHGYIYIYKHKVFQTYNRNFCISESEIKLIVSVSSFEPLLCCAANFTDLLSSLLVIQIYVTHTNKSERQILEGHFLALHFWKDVNQLERIWRKVREMSRDPENISHMKRLKVPRLFSLDRSRKRAKILTLFIYLISSFTYLFSS